MSERFTFRRAILTCIVLLFLGIILFSGLLIVKPGASIFHYKKKLDAGEFVKDAGQSYRYTFTINPAVLRISPVLMFEDGAQLDIAPNSGVEHIASGSYALEHAAGNQYLLFFSSSDNSDPAVNGRQYTLLLPVTFLNKQVGFITLFFCLSLAAWFMIFFDQSVRRAGLAFSLDQVFDLLEAFIRHRLASPQKWDLVRAAASQGRSRVWLKIFGLSVLCAYLYVLMEWLFFATKPSFMAMMPLTTRVSILLMGGFWLTLICAAGLLVLAVLDALFARFLPSIFFIQLGTYLPSLILGCLALILLDNFTYTVFDFGIVASSGYWRLFYIAFLLAAAAIFNNKIVAGIRPAASTGQDRPLLPRYLGYALGALLTISLGIVVFRIDFASLGESLAGSTAARAAVQKPNIIILGSDGLNAANLSAYGYYRETTPRIQQLALDSLFMENAFTNAAHSSGSVISMLTGKPPRETRVLYPPDILNGSDSYQHLPGILHTLGYYTVEIGVPHYVDAFNMNLLDGFDVVNQRTVENGSLGKSIRVTGFGDVAYFITLMNDRLSQRVLHIFFIKDMENPFVMVTQPTDQLDDQQRLDDLLDLIEQSEQPFFVHVHMMVTHGDYFNPREQYYSLGVTQDDPWMIDYYDDAIRQFDQDVGVVIDALKQAGKYDSTILVIYTDHGMSYEVNGRIPLIIHFPEDEFAGRLQVNAQNLDIAPTLLDYLNLTQPEWMHGSSLIAGDLPANRLIFSSRTKISTANNVLNSEQVKPPFYQFTYLGIVQCQNWFRIDLRDMQWTSGSVAGHTTPCPPESLDSLEEIQRKLKLELAVNGFDISTIP